MAVYGLISKEFSLQEVRTRQERTILARGSRTAAQASRPWSVLILSRHSTLAASSRLRTHQYIPFLESMGAQITVAPFFDRPYLEKLYASGRRSVLDIARAYARRVTAVAKVRQASVVWIEKELFPFAPGFMEAILANMGVPYVVDYDDAIFHTYDNSSNRFVQRVLGRKLDSLLKRARTVTVGSAYLETYVRARGARFVARVPTVVDLSRYAAATEPAGREIRVGWIGTPMTTKYLLMLREPLLEIARTRPIRLVTIGAGPLDDFGVPLEQHPWSAETEAAVLGTIHVGVMPLPDEPWERGKCGYKLLQYMAVGRPVIASPVGTNPDIVTPEVGILAGNSAEWSRALALLIDGVDQRQRLGQQARQRVETFYSLQVMAPRVCAILADAAAEP
jgi:glycosyltransferase involved in cell wall biosynthesis